LPLLLVSVLVLLQLLPFSDLHFDLHLQLVTDSELLLVLLLV